MIAMLRRLLFGTLPVEFVLLVGKMGMAPITRALIIGILVMSPVWAVAIALAVLWGSASPVSLLIPLAAFLGAIVGAWYCKGEADADAEWIGESISHTLEN